MNKPTKYLLLAAKGVAVGLMLQTLYFKFQAAAESVYIFTKVGIEPWGRIGTGVIELIASALILIPRASWIGAGLGLGVMAGAILTHLTLLGIEVRGDGGQLFFYAIAVAASCLTILYITRWPWISVLIGLLGGRFAPRKPSSWSDIR
ncbi:MAG: DoxX family protein [Bacteroidetes bacterium]|nr:DoxX family protein [Fibrella sp.]